MRLRQIGLHLQGLLREGARFFAALGRSLEKMNDPAFQQRIACDGKRKRWVELNGSLVKLLALFELLKVLHRVGKIVRLDKSEVSLAVFGRLAFDSRPFRGRKFGLECVADFLGEI